MLMWLVFLEPATRQHSELCVKQDEAQLTIAVLLVCTQAMQAAACMDTDDVDDDVIMAFFIPVIMHVMMTTPMSMTMLKMVFLTTPALMLVTIVMLLSSLPSGCAHNFKDADLLHAFHS